VDYDENRDDRFIYRLGNYTLLTKTENRDIGNKNYEVKKPVFENSKFVLTQNIAKHADSWDIEKIEQRQQKLAKTAKEVWKL